MPTKATVSGVFIDADSNPVAGCKVVATFVGSDFFGRGQKLTTFRVEDTTGPDGAWEMDLIVNSEGQNNTTSWTIEGFDRFAVSAFRIAGLFIATGDPITLSQLEMLSAFNLRAANDDTFAQLIVVEDFAEYEALPAGQKRPTDLIIQPIEV